jgi:hypothetical protein
MQIFSSVPVASGKWERRERERGVREEEERVGLRQRRERLCFF